LTLGQWKFIFGAIAGEVARAESKTFLGVTILGQEHAINKAGYHNNMSARVSTSYKTAYPDVFGVSTSGGSKPHSDLRNRPMIYGASPRLPASPHSTKKRTLLS